MPHNVALRDVTEDDLPIFFEQQLDPEANHMVAFTARDPADREAFMAHWAKILADDTLFKQTVLVDGQVAGNIGSFEQSGHREVGYWIGREYWGKGVATQALAAFLRQIQERPLYGFVAKDNIASRRVLEKCGFTLAGEDKEFSNARGEEVEAFIMMLEASDRSG
jgi:RimJ/RimL family protein N-acetyltransferase